MIDWRANEEDHWNIESYELDRHKVGCALTEVIWTFIDLISFLFLFYFYQHHVGTKMYYVLQGLLPNENYTIDVSF